MEPSAIIGQAVVTDPGSGRSSGYVLVAASPGVDPRDAQHLAAAPQVTDYLHLEASPGPFFSFYPLPSGRWALSKRFVRGTRRGAFNRVVAHTLLVPEEVLRRVEEEPWLLLTRCRFRDRRGGPEMTPAELGDRAGEVGVEALPDLVCQVPSEPSRERYALLRRRCEMLRKRWQPGTLREKLETIFAAIAAGRRVLLPQDSESEQLLALGWSALPVGDRLDSPWTTHLAPAAASLFRVANTPDPEAVRGDQADPEQWALVGDDPAPDDAGGGSRALAGIVLEDGRELADLYGGLRLYRLRLATASAAVSRWVAWLRRDGPAFLQGFSSRDELARFLGEFRLGPDAAPREPWISLPGVLGCAAGTVDRLTAAGQPAEAALAAVSRTLEETHWRQSLLTPAVVAELVPLTAEGLVPLTAEGLVPLAAEGLSPRTVPIAVALCLRRLPAPPEGLSDREALLQALLAAPDPDGRCVELRARILAELAGALVGAGSASADAAFGALAGIPDGLERVLAQLEPRPRDLPAMLATFRAAEEGSNLAGRVAAKYLVPLLLDEPELLAKKPTPELVDWGAELRHVADAAEAAGQPEKASMLRACWWRELARRPWERFPVEALPMLDGLHGVDRRVVAELWIARAGDLGQRPGEPELLSRLAALAAEDPELSFTFDVGRLAASLRSGDLDLETAAARAAGLARQRPGGATAFRTALTRALEKLLPGDPEARRTAVVALLLSPRLMPSAKRVLDTSFRDRALRAAATAGGPLVRELAGRGNLLLRAARQAGARWSGDPDTAAGFVREASVLRRYDAVAAFLRSAEAADGDSRSFLRYLAAAGDTVLLGRLGTAARSRAHRWDLSPYAARIHRLEAETWGSRQ